MAEVTKIQWANHTFNPWRGCTKVSAGCDNCYAETMSKRNPAVLGIWGDDGTRVVASESMWREPLKWDKAAFEAGERHRVFCASLADVWEDRDDIRLPRLRLMGLIEETHNLDWLLLTKRPQNILQAIKNSLKDLELFPEMAPWPALAGKMLQEWLVGKPPSNVWLGTSVENQAAAAERVPELMKLPARVRFLSVEPLLGPINLAQAHPWTGPRVDWVIIGGESGHGARPCHVEWVRDLVRQCKDAKVAVFVKQLGSNPAIGSWTKDWPKFSDPKGGDPSEWPPDLCVREFPHVQHG